MVVAATRAVLLLLLLMLKTTTCDFDMSLVWTAVDLGDLSECLGAPLDDKDNVAVVTVNQTFCQSSSVTVRGVSKCF